MTAQATVTGADLRSAEANRRTSSPSRKPLAELVAREARRRKRRRWIAAALLVCVPVAGFATYEAARPRPAPYAARFRTQPVTRGDVVREVRATGHVEAVTTVQVGAEISGRIQTVEVDYNDHVKQGQILARFDRASLEAQATQTGATLAAARATLEQARTDRERLATDAARAERLFATRSIPDADRDNAVAAARLAQQRVGAAEAQLAAQRAAFDLARTNLDHTVIRAPIDGVVITRNVDPGQTVASVLQTPVLFTVAADLRKMRVIAAVDEADIGEVAPAQNSTFGVNAYPDRVFEGVVTEVRNSPVVVQDVVTYGTVVEVDNLDLALKPGMTASVRVRTASQHDVQRVAVGALHFAAPGDEAAGKGGPGVWLVQGDALRRVPVLPGVSDGEVTAIAPGALDDGTSVVVELTPEGRRVYGLRH